MLLLALCFVWNHSFYFHHQRTGCGPENWVPEQHNFFAGLHQRYQLLHSLGAGLLSQIKTTSLLFSFPLHQRTQDMVKQQLKKLNNDRDKKKDSVRNSNSGQREIHFDVPELILSMYIGYVDVYRDIMKKQLVLNWFKGRSAFVLNWRLPPADTCDINSYKAEKDNGWMENTWQSLQAQGVTDSAKTMCTRGA